MKFPILAVFTVLLCGFSLSAQQPEISVFQKDLDAYSRAYNSRDWDTVVSKLNPGIFEISSKEEIVEQLKKLDASGIGIQFIIKKIISVSPIVEYENRKYCKINYETEMTVKVSGEALQYFEQLADGFVHEFSDGKVAMDGTNKIIKIQAPLLILAEFSSEKNQWTYLEKNSRSHAVFDMLIPQPVLQQLFPEEFL